MASGKRASMREGPLAALFRRTDEDVPEGAQSTPEAKAPETTTPAAPQQPAAPAQPQASAPQPPAPPLPEAAVPPATPAAAARRREPDPLLDAGPASTPPPHPRQTGYPHPSLNADAEPAARQAPSAQERLRNAFSTELPDDILAPPAPAPAPARAEPAPSAPAGDPYAARSANQFDESPWGAKVAGSPVIRVVGVGRGGGAGVNAVNRMVEAEVQGVEFLAINTDLQSLQQSTADITLHIGPQVTRGLGAGSDPELGRQAAMEEYDRIKSLLKGS